MQLERFGESALEIVGESARDNRNTFDVVGGMLGPAILIKLTGPQEVTFWQPEHEGLHAAVRFDLAAIARDSGIADRDWGGPQGGDARSPSGTDVRGYYAWASGELRVFLVYFEGQIGSSDVPARGVAKLRTGYRLAAYAAERIRQATGYTL